MTGAQFFCTFGCFNIFTVIAMRTLSIHQIRFLIISCFLFQFSVISAQDSLSETPFLKGSTLVLASGSFSSTVLYGKQFSENKNLFANNYLLGISSLHLVKNRFGIGGEIFTGRSESEELVKLETEILYFGPVFRYYVSESSTGSLFPQISIVYTNYYSFSSTVIDGKNVDESLSGKGAGLNFEFGFAYPVNKHVNLEVAMKYSIHQLWGNLEQPIEGSVTEVSFTRSQLAFSLTFGILFHKKDTPDD